MARNKREIKNKIIEELDKWEQEEKEDDWKLLDCIVTLLINKGLEEVLQ